MMYYPHNIDFLWYATSMDGRFADSLRAAREMQEATPAEMVRQMNDVESGMVAPLFVLARFGRWNEILLEPTPPEDLPFATGSWHFARGLADVRLGKLDDARKERDALVKTIAATAPERGIQIVNKAREIMDVQSSLLAAEIAAADGKHEAAITEFEKAVAQQDKLRYMEPPPFYFPVRQALGAELLAAGRAGEAEAVYRADLKANPGNGWSLFGLEASLRAQGKNEEAAQVKQQFDTAWTRADVKLTSSRF
jgi:tetratricopeptide (TPR) repeat protein